MRSLLLFILPGLVSTSLLAQQNYTEKESKYRRFGPRNGALDSISGNPSASQVNANQQVIKYDRSNSVTYDNLKIYPIRRLVDVSAYASYSGNAPKIRMKVYSSAPAGTRVEIQLGKKGDDNYPSGVHSQYEAVTTKQNQWEELSFTFSLVPQGSQVPPTDVDKITVMFSPNSYSSDTYYFDELIGPPMIPEPVKVAEAQQR